MTPETFFKKTRRFLDGDAGAVTVDWVVLTAAVVGLGIGAAAAVRTGTGALGEDVSASLSGSTVASLECLGTNDGPSGFECYSGPTIQSAGMPTFWAQLPSCMMAIGGATVCDPPRSGSSQEFRMSDGSTYYRYTETIGNETTERWADASGNTVDAPPPLPDGSYNYPIENPIDY